MPTQGVFEVGSLKFIALGDRLLVREDEFRTGYECATCTGKGTITCPQCNGTKHYTIEDHERTCTACQPNGTTRCADCNGKGGLLVAPEITERRPTTGTIVSVGPGIWSNGVFVPTTLKVGDSVLYSNFAGYVVDLDRAGVKVTLRILHETEVLCRMEGHLTLANLKGKSEVTTFTT